MAFKLIETEATRGRRISTTPEFTIRTSGLVAFNKVVADAVAGKENVEIYWDEEERRIGLKFVKTASKASVKVGKQGFSAKSKLAETPVDFSGNTLFPAELVKDMYVLKLSEGKKQAPRTRKKKEGAQPFPKEEEGVPS